MQVPVPGQWPDLEYIRKWQYILSGVIILFAVSEVVALSGVIPKLKPLELSEITNNILFAIGFGCPLVMQLSSLPGWKVVGVTAAASLLIGFGMFLTSGALSAPQGVVATGLASLSVMAIGIRRSQGFPRTVRLSFFLPACAALVFTLEVGIFLRFISSLFPETYDATAFLVDATFGFQPSFATGRLFEALPWLGALCFAIYVAPPPALVFVYALQIGAGRKPAIDIVTAILVMTVTGYLLYFIFPVCGPKFAFGSLFPLAPPDPNTLAGPKMFVPVAPRNAIPSLHLSSTLLAYWFARPYGAWPRAVAMVFVIGTFLATIGTGEHYLVDLVMAFPFTLTVLAALIPSHDEVYRQKRLRYLLVSFGLLGTWYGILWGGYSLLSPWLTWTLTLATIGTVWKVQKKLFDRLTV